MTIIPHDVLLEILQRLPVKSLVRLKCVCKAWKCYVESSNFIEHHFHRTLQPEWDYSSSLILTCGSSLYVVDDLDSPSLRPRKLAFPRAFQYSNRTVKVVGSCNGWLCIATGRGSNHMFLCNPSNPSSFKILPFAHSKLSKEMWRIRDSPSVVFMLGFGCDRHGDGYKIIYAWEQTWYEFEMFLYCSKAGSWKECSQSRDFISAWFGHAVVLNNCLHWNHYGNEIMRFDLHSEQWSNVDLFDCWAIEEIGVLGGCLSVTRFNWAHNERELWIMREYNVKESWTRLFTFPSRMSHVLCYSTRRHQFLLVDDAYHDLGWYSLEEKKIVQSIEIEGDLEISEIQSFVGTLVPVMKKRYMDNNICRKARTETWESTSTRKKRNYST